MSTQTLAVLGTSGVTVQTADTAATASTVPLRDSNGDQALGNVATATTVLKSLGGLNLAVSTQTASTFTPAITTASIYLMNTASSSITANLPSGALSAGVLSIFIKTSASNSAVLDGASAETVGGAATKTATAQYAAIGIVGDGTNWQVLFTVGTWS